MTVAAPNSTSLTPAQFADVIQGLQFNRPLSAHQSVVATGVIASRIVDRPSLVRDLVIAVGTTGTAGSTSVDVKKNGVSMLAAPLSVANTEADGTLKSVADFLPDAAACEAGDILTVEVTAAPTAGANLDATMNLDLRFDPPAEKALLGP